MSGLRSGSRAQQWQQEQDAEFDLTSQRPIFHKVSYPPRISLNGLLVGLLSTISLVVSGFVLVQVPSPLSWFGPAPQAMMPYSLQLPLGLFLATLLGPFMGPAVVILFLTVGLFFFPVFANGGGLHYVFQPGFGYLLAIFLMAWPLSKRFHKAFQRPGQASRSLKIIVQALAAVFMVHLLGIAYLIVLTMTHQLSMHDLFGCVLRLSLEPLPYDFLATTLLLCLVRQVRLALWLVLY